MSETRLIEKAIKANFPTGPAYAGLESGVMAELNNGLAVQVERDRQEAIKILSDFMPCSTSLVSEWEETFKLSTGIPLTMKQRAKRLAAAWSHISPGSFNGMNEIYRLSGLDCIARPLRPGEDPRVIATTDFDRVIYNSVCDIDTRCGAQTVCGDSYFIGATADVRVLADGRPGNQEKNFIIQCGSQTTCGTHSICGDFNGYNIIDPELTIPDETWTWPLIYIVEDASGNFAQIESELKDAFDFLTYKMKPEFMWVIVRVAFV
jgi:hypothetical protein